MKLVPLAAIALVGVGVTTRPITCYPRMRDTPSVLPYEQRAPDTPPGIAPFAAENAYPPRLASPPPATNPVPMTAESVRLGQIYYSYYCQQCHNSEGRGAGPVGRSYAPVAPALNTPRVRQTPDAELARVMVSGVGHAPVLETTVPAERRWYIVNYLRVLVTAPAEGAPSGSPRPAARAAPQATGTHPTSPP